MCKQHLPATAICCTAAKSAPQRVQEEGPLSTIWSAPKQRSESHSTAPRITAPGCSKLTLIVHQALRMAQHKRPGSVSLQATRAIPVWSSWLTKWGFDDTPANKRTHMSYKAHYIVPLPQWGSRRLKAQSAEHRSTLCGGGNAAAVIIAAKASAKHHIPPHKHSRSNLVV
jgi:hypothetical protein